MNDADSNQTDWFDLTHFDAEYQAPPGEVSLRMWREAYGEDYPEEVEPHSFLTRTDLARIVRRLSIGPGRVLVDLGCGRGGPGLWLARQTGADLIGVDQSAVAIAQATRRIPDFGLAGRARFLRGDLCATGLPEQSCDGAISIDVVMFIQDKAAVMKEAARILRPAAPFVFTAFEDRDTELYRAPLQDNGFIVEVYEEKPDWRRRQLALYERTVAEQAALSEEMGEGARPLIAEAEYFLADGLANARHIFVVGRRR